MWNMDHSPVRYQSPLLCLVFSWHLLSVFLLCVLLATSRANSNTNNEAMTLPSKLNINSQEEAASTAGNDSSTANNRSMTDPGPEAPSCDIDVQTFCPENEECKTLKAECIQCEFNNTCLYGSKQKTMCTPRIGVNCTGDQQFEREFECRFCYQLPPWQTWCNQTTDCSMNKPKNYYPARPYLLTTCWAQSDYLCLGRRCFYKQLPCNWSQGYKWSTALLLSIFLGGFGVDRFYLGLWKEALGKLLTFGGLGVWTLVDVILIAVGYIGPLDGSLYI